jgi:hypothetical protein
MNTWHFLIERELPVPEPNPNQSIVIQNESRSELVA